MYMYLSCNVKNSKLTAKTLKRAETNLVLNIFSGVLYHVHTYNLI